YTCGHIYGPRSTGIKPITITICEIAMKKRCYFGPNTAIRCAVISLILSAVVLSGCSPETAEEPKHSSSAAAQVVPPAEIVAMSDEEVEKAAARIAQQVNLGSADGLETTLWAPEKLLGDPVAISVDNQGRIWTTVTHRSNNSEFDIRAVPQWE